MGQKLFMVVERRYLAYCADAVMLAAARGIATLLADALVTIVDADGSVLGCAKAAHELSAVMLADLCPTL